LRSLSAIVEWAVALICRMVSLTELDVSSNSLQELPIGVGLLRHLRTLYADDNYLSYLPAEVTAFIMFFCVNWF